MSNYVKLTDYAAKDALSTGNPLKLIKGTEINDDLNAVQTAVATKADLASPDLLGNPTAPTQPYGNSTTRLATTAFVQAALQALYPIGSIYISVISTNPATLFGFGTWVSFAAGKSLVGIDSDDALFDVVEETGGSKDAVVVSHTHAITDAGHTHDYSQPLGGTGGTFIASSAAAFSAGNNATTVSSTTGITIDSFGVSGTNANLPPYVVVYMWKRTA